KTLGAHPGQSKGGYPQRNLTPSPAISFCSFNSASLAPLAVAFNKFPTKPSDYLQQTELRFHSKEIQTCASPCCRSSPLSSALPCSPRPPTTCRTNGK